MIFGGNTEEQVDTVPKSKVPTNLGEPARTNPNNDTLPVGIIIPVTLVALTLIVLILMNQFHA